MWRFLAGPCHPCAISPTKKFAEVPQKCKPSRSRDQTHARHNSAGTEWNNYDSQVSTVSRTSLFVRCKIKQVQWVRIWVRFYRYVTQTSVITIVTYDRYPSLVVTLSGNWKK